MPGQVLVEISQPTTQLYGWKGDVFPQGSWYLPVDLYYLWGYELKNPEPDPDPETNPPPDPDPPAEPADPPALTLINNAADSSEIEVLPGIGEVSATRIFTARPVDGFVSLTAVAEVPLLSVAIDWDAVLAWSPS